MKTTVGIILDIPKDNHKKGFNKVRFGDLLPGDYFIWEQYPSRVFMKIIPVGLESCVDAQNGQTRTIHNSIKVITGWTNIEFKPERS